MATVDAPRSLCLVAGVLALVNTVLARQETHPAPAPLPEATRPSGLRAQDSRAGASRSGLSKPVESDAGCSHGWYMRSGDTMHTGAACFAGRKAQQGEYALTQWPSESQLTRVVAVDTARGIAVSQTSLGDLQAVNATSGAVIWQTYNISGVECVSEACGAFGRAATIPTIESGISAGVVDETRGIIYITFSFSFIAANISTGELLWSADVLPDATSGPTIPFVAPTGGTVLIQAWVLSNIPTVVTNIWWIAVDVATRSQRWWYVPSQYRDSCLDPVFSSDGAAFYTACDMNSLMSPPNVTVMAVNLASGDEVWSTLLPDTAAVMASTSNLVLDSVSNVLHLTTGNAASTNCTMWSLNASTGGIVASSSVSLSGVLVTSTQAQYTSRGEVQSLVGMTSDGLLASVDVSTGTVNWATPLGLRPLGPNTRSYYFTNIAWDPASLSFAFSYWSGNGSGALVTAQVLSDWSGDRLVISSSAALPGSGLPIVMSSRPTNASNCAAPACQTLSLLVLSRNFTLAQATAHLPAGGAPVSPSMWSEAEVQLGWFQHARGRVWGTPAIVTNPADPSQARLLYLGLDDGIVRCGDLATNQLVWSQSFDFAGSMAYNVLLADWNADLVVVADESGDLFTLSLATGNITNTLPVGSALASLYPQPNVYTPMYVGDVTLVKDESNMPFGTPFAVILSVSPIALIGPSARAKAYLPAPGFSEDPLALLAYNMSVGGDQLVLGYASRSVVGYVTELGRAICFTAVQYQKLVALDAHDGSTVWELPFSQTGTSTYAIRDIAFSPQDSLVLAILMDGSQNTLAQLSALDGGIGWTARPCALADSGIVLHPNADVVYASCDNSGDGHGKIVALARSGGTVLWWSGQRSDTMVSGLALSPSGQVIYGEAGGVLVYVDAQTGVESARLQLDGAAFPAEYYFLNYYPAFIWTPVTDMSAGAYAAGGDDGHLYSAVAPQRAGPTISPNASALPSASVAPSGTSSTVPREPDTPHAHPPANRAGVIAGSTVGALLCVGVAVALVMFYRRRTSSTARGDATGSRVPIMTDANQGEDATL